jgi:hypothetical protein
MCASCPKRNYAGVCVSIAFVHVTRLRSSLALKSWVNLRSTRVAVSIVLISARQEDRTPALLVMVVSIQ